MPSCSSNFAGISSPNLFGCFVCLLEKGPELSSLSKTKVFSVKLDDSSSILLVLASACESVGSLFEQLAVGCVTPFFQSPVINNTALDPRLETSEQYLRQMFLVLKFLR